MKRNACVLQCQIVITRAETRETCRPDTGSRYSKPGKRQIGKMIPRFIRLTPCLEMLAFVVANTEHLVGSEVNRHSPPTSTVRSYVVTSNPSSRRFLVATRPVPTSALSWHIWIFASQSIAPAPMMHTLRPRLSDMASATLARLSKRAGWHGPEDPKDEARRVAYRCRPALLYPMASVPSVGRTSIRKTWAARGCPTAMVRGMRGMAWRC